MEKEYLKIVAHYESCLALHGDSHLGVDWPKKEDVDTRYRVMLEIIQRQDALVSLLDFGCGAAHLYDYIQRQKLPGISYSGADISPRYIDLCTRKYPDLPFYIVDILDNPPSLPKFDFIVVNGVFTEKRELSFDQMWDYFTAVLPRLFALSKRGLAFNVMSKHVDWEREDLFHVPFDMLATFLRKNLSRHFQFRQDYGLFEYTTYVYR